MDNSNTQNVSHETEHKIEHQHEKRKKMELMPFLKKYWPAILVVGIIFLGMYVRMQDYRWPYLRNIDSYTFLRQMDEIIANGGVMPTYDNLMFAPDGIPRNPELFPYQYLGAYGFMFASIFFPGISLTDFLIYLPVILASLAAIPMYFIGRTLYDRKAGVLAAFFIVFDIANIQRSLGGDPDSDAIVILMPLIVMAVFLYLYKHIDSIKSLDKKAIIFTGILGILMGLWNQIWIGYWYVVWIITGFLILKFVFDFVGSRKITDSWKNIKPHVYSYIIFMMIFFVFFALPFQGYGFQRIAYTFTGPIEFQSIKSEENMMFPNVYVSVAELQSSGDLKQIIQRTSAIDFSSNPIAMLISPFFLMVYSLLYLSYSYFKRRKHLDTIILLLIWFIGPLSATLIAVRFSILFSAPMAIGSAILLSKILRILNTEDKGVEE